MSDTEGMGQPPNGKDGIQGTEAEPEQIDKTKKFIIIDSNEGWITARIHLDQGLYSIVGFLKEVEDNVRYFYVSKKKEAEAKKDIVKPGFRGFNLFKK